MTISRFSSVLVACALFGVSSACSDDEPGTASNAEGGKAAGGAPGAETGDRAGAGGAPDGSDESGAGSHAENTGGAAEDQVREPAASGAGAGGVAGAPEGGAAGSEDSEPAGGGAGGSGGGGTNSGGAAATSGAGPGPNICEQVVAYLTSCDQLQGATEGSQNCSPDNPASQCVVPCLLAKPCQNLGNWPEPILDCVVGCGG